MCEKRETCGDNICKMPGTIKLCAPETQDVLSLKAHSFRGKQMCVGHAEEPPPPTPPEVIVPTSRLWTSNREKVNEEENRVRQYMRNQTHYESRADRYKVAQRERQKLQMRNAREIRRFRYPCTYALPLELEEDGYLKSASILEGFVHYNETMRKLASRGSPFYDEPPLAERPDLMQKIADWLMVVEDAGREDPPNQAKQIDTLLEMAFHFLDQSETVAWITEKVLLVAIDLASEYPNDGYRKEALARFAYGCLLRNFQLFEHAVQELDRARNVSLGKSWTFAGFEYETKYETVVLEVTDVLCSVLLEMAREARVSNPSQCVRYCSRAIRRLGEKPLVALQAEALLELGMGYKQADDVMMAERAFTEYLRRYDDPSFVSGICYAYLECAHCYTRMKNVEKAQEFMLQAIETAEAAGLREQVAVAQRYIGESFMKMGYFKEASRCLVESFKIYLEVGNAAQLERLRVLSAISLGMQVMPRVSELLNTSIDDKSGISFAQFLRWRTHRTPFWDMNAPDAPVFPDQSFFNKVEETEQDVFWIGSKRVDMQEAMRAFTEYAKRRRDADTTISRLHQRKQEEKGYFGKFVQENLPGYEVESTPYRMPEYTVLGGAARTSLFVKRDADVEDPVQSCRHKLSSSGALCISEKNSMGSDDNEAHLDKDISFIKRE